MKSVFFLKSLLFYIFYCFCMFVNKHFIYLRCIISESKQCYNPKSLTYYLYVKTKISVDFHICISVPLKDCLMIMNYFVVWLTDYKHLTLFPAGTTAKHSKIEGLFARLFFALDNRSD